MNFLSKNIKYLRNSKGLTQDDIAKIVNKSRVSVSHWEADEREITTEDIIKLSDYFNVPMDSLIGQNLALTENKIDETEVLFDKYKQYLSEKDKNIIKAVLEETKKEVDKERGED